MNRKYKMTEKLLEYIPVGIHVNQLYRVVLLLVIIPSINSLQFFASFYVARREQIRLSESAGSVIPMENFVEILGNGFVVFPIAALGCLAIAIYTYGYHYGESMSIYLMKRLPDKYELGRRIFTVPMLSAVMIVGWGMMLLLIYYLYYMNFSPEGSVMGNQWSILLNVWF